MSLGGIISGPCAHNPPFFNDVHSFLQNIMGELSRMRDSADMVDMEHQKEADKLRKEIEQERHEARECMNKFRYEFDELVHRRVETVLEGLEEMERTQKIKDHSQQRQIDECEQEVDKLTLHLGKVGKTWKRVKHNSLNTDRIVRNIANAQRLRKPAQTEKEYIEKTGQRRQSYLSAAIADLSRQKAASDNHALAEQVRIRLKGAAQFLHKEDWEEAMRRAQHVDPAGQLSFHEFRAMCRTELRLQEPDSNLKIIFDCLDFDGSGEISLSELVEFVASPAERMRSRLRAAVVATGNNWQTIIDEFDTDKNAEISLLEFRRLCRSKLKLPEKDFHLASVFMAIDADNSGEVSLNELTAWVEGRR